MTNKYNIFIGHDDREDDFYKLCEYSMRSTSSHDLNINPLKHLELRKKGLFNRPWQVDGITGQFIDMVDNKPFSTQFSHSRFLAPVVALQMGITGLVMFCDCDFIFRDDITVMLDQIEQFNKGTNRPVYVVKHDYKTSKSLKMDNKVQSQYEKKLWSSLMVFNLDHPDVKALTKSVVNTSDGNFLHTFKWVKDEKSIGAINERWNFIPSHSEDRVDDNMIGAIHYTEGGPNFDHLKTCEYSDVYYEVEEQYMLDKYMELTNNAIELTVIR